MFIRDGRLRDGNTGLIFGLIGEDGKCFPITMTPGETYIAYVNLPGGATVIPVISLVSERGKVVGLNYEVKVFLDSVNIATGRPHDNSKEGTKLISSTAVKLPAFTTTEGSTVGLFIYQVPLRIAIGSDPDVAANYVPVGEMDANVCVIFVNRK